MIFFKKYTFLIVCSFFTTISAQVKYTIPNAADNLVNLYNNDPSVKVWGGIKVTNENDVQKFADIFVEAMFLWIYENKLEPIQPILVMTKPSDPLFKINVRFQKFDNSRTIARAHSPINFYDKNDINWKNIILVDFDKWIDLNKNQKMWLMSHEIMHELFATAHGEAGELMYPSIPSLDDNRNHKIINGTTYYYTKSETDLINALEKAWQFIWDNHCTKKGAFTILRTLRQI